MIPSPLARPTVDSSERHLRFRPDIEGLRAVAILLVVLYHAGWHGAASGYLGVDVFFVLSGFLITGLLLDEVDATGTISLSRFWARRARRLLPAAAFVSVVVLILDRFLLSLLDQVTFAETARAFAIYASNILLAIRSTDYFGGAAVRDPLLHTWSLSVEEQFYLLFAPVMAGLAYWARRGLSGTVNRRFVTLVSVASILSLGGCLLLVQRLPVIAFYSLPVRAWEFGMGALAVFAVRKTGHLRPGILEGLALFGIAAVLLASAHGRGEGEPPLGLLTLVPTAGTVALIVSGASSRGTVIARVLSTAPLRLLGRLSYSWYLWHWPMLVYLHELVPAPSLRLSLLVAVLSLIPASLTYLLIESPVRFSTRLRQSPRVTIAGAVVLAVGTWGAGTLAARLATRTLQSPYYQNILAARAKPRVYEDGCQVSWLVVESPPCAYGPIQSDTTVVLFGDSHAAQWFPALDSIAGLRGWRLVNLTKRGCPSVSVQVPNGKLGREYRECDLWRRNTITRIAVMHPTMVIVSNDRSYNVIVGDQQPHTDSSAAARHAWKDGLVETLLALRPHTAHLVVLEDTPQPQVDVPNCLVKNLAHPERCPAPDVSVALNQTVLASERGAVAAVPGVTLVSLNEYICGPATCPVVQGGVIRYQDDSHLSIRFSSSLTPQLSQLLSRVLSSQERRP